MRILLLTLLMAPALLQGQIHYKTSNEDNLELHIGALTADSSQADSADLVVTSAILKIQIDKVRGFKTKIDKSGSQVLFLDLGHLYDIQLSAHGCVKRILLDTRAIPEEDQVGGFQVYMNVLLLQDFNARQRRYLRKTPIGHFAYDSITNSIEYDLEYTLKVQAHLESLGP